MERCTLMELEFCQQRNKDLTAALKAERLRRGQAESLNRELEVQLAKARAQLPQDEQLNKLAELSAPRFRPV